MVLLPLSVFDASVALLAFAMSMWVVLPWAFMHDVLKTEDPRPLNWLTRAQQYYLFAGVFFILECVTELGHEAYPSGLTDLTGAFFVAGLAFLSVSIYDSQRVMAFVITNGIPTYHPSRWGLNISVIAITGMDVLLMGSYLVIPSLRSSILTNSFEAGFFFTLVVSLAAGLELIYLNSKNRYPKTRYQWFSTVYLLAAPYITLTAIVIFGRFFG